MEGVIRFRHVVPQSKMVAFWLSPTASAREYFLTVIKELAQRYSAPVFEPHVTLCGGNLAEERAVEILSDLCIREPIELEITGIQYSEKYTKTLFVQFGSSPRLEALAAEIEKAAASEHSLNPHLSLIYKEMPRTQKAEAARAITLPFERVTFDSVTAIMTPHPITTSEHVEAWRMLGARRLDSASE
jgi:2'-5' RNA ligase